jgi:hypothetical protein
VHGEIRASLQHSKLIESKNNARKKIPKHSTKIRGISS